MARIVIVGLGYVGLTSAVGLAKLGHDVSGFDINSNRVQTLAGGISPIFESGLEEELVSQISSSKLTFHSDLNEAAKKGAEFFFVCVPTPQDDSGAADLRFVQSAIKDISALASAGSTIVLKSTVPVGTGAKIFQMADRSDLHVASNPEFLREGTALWDFMNPDRVVVGSATDSVGQNVMKLYKDLDCKKIVTTLESSELIKYASNSYLAMRLSFVNELAALSETVGTDTNAVLDGVGSDSRIGNRFLKQGPGWGGSCFPKDTRALISLAEKAGSPMPLVEAAVKSNGEAFERVVRQTQSLLGGSLKGKTVGVWGLAFKANTDDTRDSPALEVISRLQAKGASVRAFDPVARAEENQSVVTCATAIEAATGSHALLVLTEWSEFADVNPEDVRHVMAGETIFDTRKVLNQQSWGAVFPKFHQLGKAIR
jgi:UDPglucose 6-dehydrogenase